MHHFRRIAVATLLSASVALSSTGASAAVTFDPLTGTGFVGKGDVQLVYGWNNAQLQKNASGVGFSYEVNESYEATCTFVTGEGTKGEKTHNIDHKRKTSLNSVVEREARRNKQGGITGFRLTGYGASTSEGSAPMLGGSCQGGTGGTWTSVTQTSSSSALFVHYLGGDGIQIA